MGMTPRMLVGLGSGLAATVAMSGVMLAGRRAGVTGALPPEKITAKTLDHLRIQRSKRAETALVAGAHAGYGMVAGALFAWLTRGAPRRPRIAMGMGFRVLVWTASYFSWVPALGVMPSPLNDRPGRSLTMLLAHLVFGGVLGALEPRAERLAAGR